MSTFENLFSKLLRLFDRIPLNTIVGFGSSTRSFAEYFPGFEKLSAVQDLFGDKTEQTLGNIKVNITWFSGYMFVNNSNGHLVVSNRYLRNGDKVDIYLDLIHELCHIKQFMQGRELFDNKFEYVDRPTEIEAYRHTIQEARRLGLSDKRICQYLRTEWINNRDLKRLANSVGVSCK